MSRANATVMSRFEVRAMIASGAFAIAQLAIVLGGFADSGALCDDAFYYFQIAKNAAAGNGFSFDGLHATNGFHPLLGWISVPVFAAFGDSPWLPIRIILCVLALANAATAYVLFRIGRSMRDDRVGYLMTLFYTLSPVAWIVPLRGCEGGLEVLCTALVVWQVARIRERRLDIRQALVLGALVGLAGLARTETVFLAVGVFGWLLARRAPIRSVVVCAAAAAVVVSPWLIWSWYECGTIVQVSGAAKVSLRLHHPLPAVDGPITAVRNVVDVFVHTARFVVGEEGRPARFTVALVICSAVLMTAIVIAGGRRRPSSVLVPVAVFVALHIIYYAFVQRSYFNWYFMPVAFGAAMFKGERLAEATVVVTRVALAASAVICAGTLALFYARYPRVPHGAELTIGDKMAAVAELPPGARAGGWNIGRVGYFGTIQRPDVKIINLDCVVNNKLFEAWRRGEYDRWVVDNVEWLVERPQGALDRRFVEHRHGSLSRIIR